MSGFRVLGFRVWFGDLGFSFGFGSDGLLGLPGTTRRV